MQRGERYRRRRGSSLLDVVIALVILVTSVLALSRSFLAALLAERKAANQRAGAAAMHQMIEEMREQGAAGLSAFAGTKVLWTKTTYDPGTGAVRQVEYAVLPAGSTPSTGANEKVQRLGTFSVTLSEFASKVTKAHLEAIVADTRATQSRVVAEALFAQE
jgi:Tfp pilus assembly protein PilV